MNNEIMVNPSRSSVFCLVHIMTIYSFCFPTIFNCFFAFEANGAAVCVLKFIIGMKAEAAAPKVIICATKLTFTIHAPAFKTLTHFSFQRRLLNNLSDIVLIQMKSFSLAWFFFLSLFRISLLWRCLRFYQFLRFTPVEEIKFWCFRFAFYVLCSTWMFSQSTGKLFSFLPSFFTPTSLFKTHSFSSPSSFMSLSKLYDAHNFPFSYDFFSVINSE